MRSIALTTAALGAEGERIAPRWQHIRAGANLASRAEANRSVVAPGPDCNWNALPFCTSIPL